MKITNFKIGSDCEWFVLDNSKNEFRSAEGLIKGTKHDPFRFDPENRGFAVSLDNVLAEGNIPPVVSKLEWLQNMNTLRQYINSTLPQTMCTVGIPAVHMASEWLQSKTARTFGCEPSYNVWTRCQNESPNVNTTLRTAGLHVHVSFDDASTDNIEELIKAMDLYLSIPAVLTGQEKLRKELYGKAGEFRFGSSYQGAEYRSLSSYFAENNQRLEWVYDNTIEAINFVNRDGVISDLAGEKIQEAVNNDNRELAEQLINEFNIPVLSE